MRRRDFIKVFAGSAAGWPRALRAQQTERKLAIIMAVGKTPEYVAAVAALEQTLGSAGWKNSENLRIDEHWSAGSEDGARSAAQEVIHSNPDVILGQSATVIEALRSATRTIPIVFLHVADPAVYGFVSNLARPKEM
jgi:putative ABC transport system substrate-binding protein